MSNLGIQGNFNTSKKKPSFMKLTFGDKLSNLFSKTKIKGHCQFCNRPIFSIKSRFGKQGKCIYCYEAEQRVHEEYKVKMYYD